MGYQLFRENIQVGIFSSILQNDSARSSAMLITTYQSTQCHIPHIMPHTVRPLSSILLCVFHSFSSL